MSLGMTYSSTVPGGGAVSYKLLQLLGHSNSYWEEYRRFQEDFFIGEEGVEGRGLRGGMFP